MIGLRLHDAPQSRKEAAARRRFERVKRAEVEYGRQLRRVASQIGHIVRGFKGRLPHDPEAMRQVDHMLRRYAELLEPWSKSVAAAMLADVASRDKRIWAEIAKTMKRDLRREIENAPTGIQMRALMTQQVGLIKSLPLEAALRVQHLAVQSLESGVRSEDIVNEIMRSGQVSKARANVIARTETGRAATTLTQARAEHVGSEGYTWETAQDEQVRPSHRKMQGKFVRWSEPPTLDNLTGHAGALPNCRCYPAPVISDEY